LNILPQHILSVTPEVTCRINIQDLGNRMSMRDSTMRIGFSAMLVVLAFLWPARAASQAPDAMSFGSQKVLEACWSCEERQGTASDRETIGRHSASPAIAPKRLAPRHTLLPLREDLRNSIRRVSTAGDRRCVALTFDLCERASRATGYDAAVVNTLWHYSVKATFFAGGKWMCTHPDKAKQLMADPLFEIGNHTWTHKNCRLLDEKRIKEQILWTQAQYELLWEELAENPCAKKAGPTEMEKIPRVPYAFRFPYGTCSPVALRVLADAGLPAIQWDVVMGDAARESHVEQMVHTVLTRTRPGSIIVGHANGRGNGTAEVLGIIIPKLRAQGYEFVTVSELLRLGKALAVEECYELKPGDNGHYDSSVHNGTR
jgi:peptidoglycan/xylan/chitin deacetylase (PgdA/CDA1 family)